MNRLDILQEVISNFIISRQGLTVLTLNYECLKKHALDLQDSISQIGNLDSIVKFKGDNVRTAGVGIHSISYW